MEAGKPGKVTERLFAMLGATGVRLYAELDDPRRRAGASTEDGSDVDGDDGDGSSDRGLEDA